MNEKDINIIYVVQAFNRPHLLAPSLLSLRNQIISRNRPIILMNDGPRNKEDAEMAKMNKLVFETFFKGYPLAEYILSPDNNGAELMFVKTFFEVFDKRGADCLALLEDDLYYEGVYVHNVERLLAQFYDDTDIVSVSGFTRESIYENDITLNKNRDTVTIQHNLIGAIYKKCGWEFLKPVFTDFVSLKKQSCPDNILYTLLNKKYDLHMPHTSYDKMVDHVFAKNRKIRASTYNRYLYHIGLFGTSNASAEYAQAHNQIALSNFITFGWDKLTTDSTQIDEYMIDKKLFEGQFNKEPSKKAGFRGWNSPTTYEEAAKLSVGSADYAPDLKCVEGLIGDPSKSLRILDFGCGMGRNTFSLSMVNAWNVVGYDNEELIKKAPEFCNRYYKYPPSNFPKVSFSSDWEKLKTEKFDCIVCISTFEHLFHEDLRIYLTEMREMTKRLVVSGKRNNAEAWSVWCLMEDHAFVPTKTFKDGVKVPYSAYGDPNEILTQVYEL
jgi:2-polyprenyl-3-methyl-5-hydroxy-6-metoxy-1,4-benzoquinol methylase